MLYKRQIMAKLMPIVHHSNCNCCGRQASFKELGRRPSGFGPLKSALLLKRPNTHHSTTRNLERKVSERVGSAQQRRRSLQHGNESTHETSPQKAFDVLTGENPIAADVTAEIADAVAERSMLQATESRMKGTSRDKESLLDECLALKTALADQRYHLQLHKVHHESVNVEQRNLEIQMGELEVAHGLKAPRTGDPSQLKARYLGLKCRQQEYFTTLTTLQDDLDVLKKDPRVSFTEEAMAERDVFASETRRLQKIIRRLQMCYHRVVEENKKVIQLRENIARLTSKISNIEKSMNDKISAIEQMKKDIEKAKVDSVEAQKNTKYATQKAEELESHSHVLQAMLTREKEEGSRIQKQTSMLSEQIRIVRKENADRALQAQIAIGMDATPSIRKTGRKAKNVAKLKDQSQSDDTSASTSLPSSPSSPSRANVNKEFDEIRAKYLKAIGFATNTFVEGAPGSGSPKAKVHPDLGSEGGDHSDYEQLQTIFVKDVTEAEDEFIAMMEKFEYGASRPKRDLEVEAAKLRAELEALKKAQIDVKKWLENLTIELDDQTLKANEYSVDVKDTKTNVRITSPDKTPEALARKRAEEEARRKKAAEETARRATEEAARLAAKEAARRAAEEAARRAAEEAARRAAEEAARLAAEEVARLAAEEEARRRAAEEEARRRAAEEEVRRRAAEEEARRRAAEEEARRRAAEEEVRRRAAEEEARRKKEIEDEAAQKRAVEEEARRRAKGAQGKEPAPEEFFDDKMQGMIKENIKDVLKHLETISDTVQQKATTSNTTEQSDKDASKKSD